MAVPTTIADFNVTASSNSPQGTDSIGTTADDYVRGIQAVTRAALAHKGADITSAASMDLGAVAGLFHDITGSTGPITGFGTVAAGIWKVLQFDSTPTITHNGTSLIIPGAANITAAAGDMCMVTSEGSGNWRMNWYTRAANLPALIGKHSIWVPASAMVSRTTSGPSVGNVETTTNDVMMRTLDFAEAADEFAQFAIAMPKSWNESTVTAKFFWSHPSTVTNFDVIWGLQGVAFSNDDALDTASGTAQTVTDTGGTTDDLYISGETSAITIAGTPAEGDLVVFQVYRDANEAGDTLAVDARLHGVMLYYTTNAGNDA